MAQATFINPGTRISGSEVLGGAFDGTEIVTLTFDADQMYTAMKASGAISDGQRVSGVSHVSISWDFEIASVIAEMIRDIVRQQTKKGR